MEQWVHLSLGAGSALSKDHTGLLRACEWSKGLVMLPAPVENGLRASKATEYGRAETLHIALWPGGQSAFTFRETLFSSDAGSFFLGKPRVITSVQATKASLPLERQGASQCDLEGWKYPTHKAGVFLDYSVRRCCLWAIGIPYLEGQWLPLPP